MKRKRWKQTDFFLHRFILEMATRARAWARLKQRRGNSIRVFPWLQGQKHVSHRLLPSKVHMSQKLKAEGKVGLEHKLPGYGPAESQ